jgi:hypothetical protein
MTKQHKATPEQWAFVKACAPEDFAGFACILELRDRIEALEVGQQPPRDKLDRLIAIDRDDPAGSLVERVQQSICDHPFGEEARAAIIEVAAWLREKGYGSWVTLEQEANR